MRCRTRQSPSPEGRRVLLCEGEDATPAPDASSPSTTGRGKCEDLRWSGICGAGTVLSRDCKDSGFVPQSSVWRLCIYSAKRASRTGKSREAPGAYWSGQKSAYASESSGPVVGRKRDVIGPRNYGVVTYKWYRDIGFNKYRFRVTFYDLYYVASAEVAKGYQVWEQVHKWEVRKANG